MTDSAMTEAELKSCREAGELILTALGDYETGQSDTLSGVDRRIEEAHDRLPLLTSTLVGFAVTFLIQLAAAREEDPTYMLGQILAEAERRRNV
jgi:hypothetical protein